MKKILSILMTLVFIVSAMPAMAEYENIDCTETYTAGVIPQNVVLETRDEAGNVTTKAETYADGTVYTRKVLEAYHSSGTNSFVKTVNKVYAALKTNNAMVYKVALPPLEPNQQYDQMWFNWTSSTGHTAADTLIKYPGENWDFTDETLNSQSPSVRKMIDTTNLAAEGEKIIIDSANGAYKRVRQDITSYANECRLAGQTYMYIGLYNASSKNVFGTQGYSGNKEDVAAISFVTGPFEGLLTVKNSIDWTDVSALGSSGTTYTNPLAQLSTLHYTSGVYALYRLPMPKLSATQTIVDYKLKVSIHGNSLGTGYNFKLWEVDDGAEYFANQWTTAEHPIDGNLIEDARAYNNASTMSYKASDEDYEPMVAHLTSYAKKLTAGPQDPEHMYVALKCSANSTLTIKGYGQDVKYHPVVEYTIYDSTGYAKGCKATELKIVPSASDRYDAADVDSLTTGTKYRAVMKATNIDEASKISNMYIATYKNGELETVQVIPCTIDALSSDYFVWSDEFTVAEAGKTVKVFLWDESDDTPLIAEQTATVVAPSAA